MCTWQYVQALEKSFLVGRLYRECLFLLGRPVLVFSIGCLDKVQYRSSCSSCESNGLWLLWAAVKVYYSTVFPPVSCFWGTYHLEICPDELFVSLVYYLLFFPWQKALFDPFWDIVMKGAFNLDWDYWALQEESQGLSDAHRLSGWTSGQGLLWVL